VPVVVAAAVAVVRCGIRKELGRKEKKSSGARAASQCRSACSRSGERARRQGGLRRCHLLQRAAVAAAARLDQVGTKGGEERKRVAGSGPVVGFGGAPARAAAGGAAAGSGRERRGVK